MAVTKWSPPFLFEDYLPAAGFLAAVLAAVVLAAGLAAVLAAVARLLV
jgi:hypothetical protein